MHHIHFSYHAVEYLASTVAENDNTGEEAVVLTLRNPGQWQPCNLGLTRPQAERLLQDLQRLLAATPILLLLLVGIGCSARVDVATERTGWRLSRREAPHERRRGLAGRQGRDSHTVSRTRAATCLGDDGEGSGGRRHCKFCNDRRGRSPYPPSTATLTCTSKRPQNQSGGRSKPERIKVEVYTPKIDPECERLRREHEKKVEEWKALMSR